VAKTAAEVGNGSEFYMQVPQSCKTGEKNLKKYFAM